MQKVSITDVYQCSQYAFARITSLLVYYFIILLNFFNFEHIHHVDLFRIHAHLFQYFPEFCNITWNSAVLLGIPQYYLEFCSITWKALEVLEGAYVRTEMKFRFVMKEISFSLIFIVAK